MLWNIAQNLYYGIVPIQINIKSDALLNTSGSLTLMLILHSDTQAHTPCPRLIYIYHQSCGWSGRVHVDSWWTRHVVPQTLPHRSAVSSLPACSPLWLWSETKYSPSPSWNCMSRIGFTQEKYISEVFFFFFFCTKSSWIKTLVCCRKCWPQIVSLTISVGTRRTLSAVLFSFSLLILVPHPSFSYCLTA